jgi:hypothetical protein
MTQAQVLETVPYDHAGIPLTAGFAEADGIVFLGSVNDPKDRANQHLEQIIAAIIAQKGQEWYGKRYAVVARGGELAAHVIFSARDDRSVVLDFYPTNYRSDLSIPAAFKTGSATN